MSNFRPISNLSTISKLLERLALSRLSSHLLPSISFNPHQSEYRKMHSTETALTRTLSNVYSCIDTGSSVLSVLLDLSAAFDTVSHAKLLTCLQNNFGIQGSVLSWLTSYLSGRTQFVSVDGVCSSPLPVPAGVPQGSVLDPLLFSAYTSPLHSVISSFGLNHQQYADDTLIFSPIPTTNFLPSMRNLEQCLAHLCMWFAHLAINPTKSDAIIFSTRQRLAKLRSTGLTTVSVLDSSIPISNTLTILGVTLDSFLSFNNHCTKISQSSLYHLRAVHHI